MYVKRLRNKRFNKTRNSLAFYDIRTNKTSTEQENSGMEEVSMNHQGLLNKYSMSGNDY